MVKLLFISLGLVAIIFNKPLARLFSEIQKFYGWEKGAFEFGRIMNFILGAIFLLVGILT
jgi:hypothetical protein